MKNIKKTRRILITGDAGRGKTTLAQKIFEKTGIKYYSTDDFYWRKKFSEKNNKQESINGISNVYDTESWIVEGTTVHLLENGFEKADVIIYLGFRGIFSQWRVLIQRHRTRKDESIFDLLDLLRHVLYKRYGLGYKKNDQKIIDILENYKGKVVFAHSYDEINNLINKF